MSDSTIPRPNIRTSIVLEYKLTRAKELKEPDKEQLQKRINRKYEEPDEMGTVQLTFSSTIKQSEYIAESVQVTTNASEITEDIVYNIQGIIEDEVGVEVRTWDMRLTSDRLIV